MTQRPFREESDVTYQQIFNKYIEDLYWSQSITSDSLAYVYARGTLSGEAFEFTFRIEITDGTPRLFRHRVTLGGEEGGTEDVTQFMVMAYEADYDDLDEFINDLDWLW